MAVNPDLILPRDISDWVFVESVRDLAQRYLEDADLSRYQLLGISAILRRLLVDKQPLVHTVNQRWHRRLEFRYAEAALQPAMERGVPGTWMVPMYAASGGRFLDSSATPRNLKSFLNAVVGEFKRKPVTVLDLIRYFAHVEGGVHRFPPSSEFEQLMSGVVTELPSTGWAWLSTLHAIGAVALEALAPLSNDIAITLPHDRGPMGLSMMVISTDPDGFTYDLSRYDNVTKRKSDPPQRRSPPPGRS